MEDLFVVREAGIVLFFPIFVFDNEPIQWNEETTVDGLRAGPAQFHD